MKEGIHPKYGKAIVRCACGNTFETGSVKPELKVEICSKCRSLSSRASRSSLIPADVLTASRSVTACNANMRSADWILPVCTFFEKTPRSLPLRERL